MGQREMEVRMDRRKWDRPYARPSVRETRAQLSLRRLSQIPNPHQTNTS